MDLPNVMHAVRGLVTAELRFDPNSTAYLFVVSVIAQTFFPDTSARENSHCFYDFKIKFYNGYPSVLCKSVHIYRI
jgi:hypothetical protein